MTRWLQAAKTAQGVSDKNDNNDFIPRDSAFLSFKSFLSGGGKADFGDGEGVQSSPSPHDPEALQMEFEEGAAILEYDGGYSRAEAERLARVELYGADTEKGGAQ